MRRWPLLWVIVTTACASAAPAEPRPPPPPDTPSAAGSDRCAGATADEQIEVAIGRTARSESKIAVTFRSISHDSYDDGRTDVLVHLVFRGVGEDGELSPSELAWLPSAFAPPAWTHLPIGRCVRLVDVNDQRAVLELHDP